MWDLWWTEWQLGQDFPEYISFPCHSFIPPIAPQSSSFIQGWQNRLIYGRSNSELGSTPAAKVNQEKVNK
jgi:hypothetical protein